MSLANHHSLRMPDPSRHTRNLAAWNSLKGATWPMFARLEARVGEADPTPAQMGVLHTLSSGEEGMTPHVLSECLHVTGATVTGNLNALEAAGLIERVRESSDRRVVNVRVTAKGREKVKKWRAIWQSELERHFGPLTDEELDVLTKLLAKLGPAIVGPPGGFAALVKPNDGPSAAKTQKRSAAPRT
jgi:DNA-binding MarR family transcriptional regulator